jgi:hypothetical protein
MLLCFLRWAIFLQVFALLLFTGSGCIKDYSFEQRPQDTTLVADQGSVPASVISPCDACNTTAIPDSSWRVTIGNKIFCGIAEKSIITLERTSFTFFGPSFCSSDSGFVATIYLGDERLNTDRTNVPARMAVYYYDRVTPSNVYQSASAQPLRLTIQTYTHQTAEATGIFSGSVMDLHGNWQQVKDGRFKIRF